MSVFWGARFGGRGYIEGSWVGTLWAVVGYLQDAGISITGTGACIPSLRIPRTLLVRMIGLEPTLPRGNWNLNRNWGPLSSGE
jgi:hypothetical protein